MDLPSRLDVTAAVSLRDWFLSCRTDALLDGSAVEVVTTPALQVMMAGRDHLRDGGHGVTIANPSSAFLACIATLGADVARLTHPSVEGAR